MHLEADTTVERPRPEVFDYLARAEHLPEYVTEFDWVRQASEGVPAELMTGLCNARHVNLNTRDLCPLFSSTFA